MIGAVVAVAVFVGVGAFGWWRFLRYERVAARHVPAEAVLAVRLDLEKIVLFEPVRKHVFPLIDEGLPPGATPRLRRVEERTGLIFGREVREIVYARGRDPSMQVGLACGRFGTVALVPVLAGILEEDGAGWRLEGDLLHAPLGRAVVGQAPDGCLLIASDEAMLRAAVSGGGLALPAEGAASLAARGDVAAHLGRRFWGEGSVIASVPLVTAMATLTDPVRVEVRVEQAPGSGGPRTVAALETLLEEARRRTSVAQDIAGEKSAFAAATVRPSPAGAVVATPWAQPDISRGFRHLAEVVRARW